MNRVGKRRIRATVAGLLFSLVLTGADWPQWRGEQSQGKSTESPLPTTWSEKSNVRWKTQLPGDGLSSPIVWQDRIYLTTAYNGAMRRTSERIIAWTSTALAAMLLFTLLKSWWRGSQANDDSGESSRQGFFQRIDRLILGLAIAVFLAVYILCSFDLNLAGHVEKLAKLPGAWRLKLTEWVPAYYFEATPGHPWAAWITSGAIALFGCALALNYAGGTARTKVIGALLFCSLAAFLFVATPRNMAQGEISPGMRLYGLIPALLLGCWIVVFRRWRSTPNDRQNWPAVALLGGMSALMFIPANYWKPEVGLLRVVVCLDAKDGRIIWETPVVAASEERKHVSNSFASPTPCTDGKHVFADFGCVTACLDLDGRVLWTATNEHYFERREYGSGASPVLAGDLVIVIRSAEQFQHSEGFSALGGSSMVAFDKETGRIRWSREPEDLSATYATPLLIERGGKSELFVLADNLGSYDPATGELLWSYPLHINQPVPGLLVDGDRVYVCGGTHDHEDTNKILALRLQGTGKDTQVELLWEKLRAAPEVSSPVLVNGRLYAINAAGIAKCLAADTGKMIWQKRLTKQARFFPSLVAGDGKVYVFDNLGQATVFADGEESNVVAENVLDEGRCHASIAVANGCLLIRIGANLYCIGE